jgi:hypothetical protein
MTDEIVKKEPIPNGDSFNGMCVSRSTSVGLYFTRITQVLVGNAGGLTYIISQLSNKDARESWPFLLAAWLVSFWASDLNRFGLSLIEESSDHIKLWTRKLILMENKNGVQGGINMFSSLDYQALSDSKEHSTIDYLRKVVLYCRIIWWLVGTISLYLLLTHKEVQQWKTIFLYPSSWC